MTPRKRGRIVQRVEEKRRDTWIVATHVDGRESGDRRDACWREWERRGKVVTSRTIERVVLLISYRSAMKNSEFSTIIMEPKLIILRELAQQNVQR